MIAMKDWERYIARLKKISDKAAAEMQAYVDRFGFGNTTAIINHAYALATKYGEAAAAAACDMYDAVAAVSRVSVPAAVPAETATYGDVAKAINGAINQGAEGQVPQITGRYVKRAGADTTLKNAIRDGAEFAWVPHGDTCAFCITLASGGWRRASEKALKGGHAEHIHSNCDCEYAIRFGDDDGVRGYDPDYYKRIYYGHGGDINSIRREQYQKNKEKINAQKREAYAKSIQKDIGAVIASHSDDYREYLDAIRLDPNKMNRRQKRLLERVSEPYSWIQVKSNNVHIRDLAALTATTGDEFAIFQRGGKKILIRGNGSKWRIPKEVFDKLMSERWNWDSHSHPIIGIPVSSPEDRNTLRRFTWQEKSTIINLKGETKEFTANEQDWFNEILGVK